MRKPVRKQYIPPRNVWNYRGLALAVFTVVLWFGMAYVVLHFIIKFW